MKLKGNIHSIEYNMASAASYFTMNIRIPWSEKDKVNKIDLKGSTDCEIDLIGRHCPECQKKG